MASFSLSDAPQDSGIVEIEQQRDLEYLCARRVASFADNAKITEEILFDMLGLDRAVLAGRHARPASARPSVGGAMGTGVDR